MRLDKKETTQICVMYKYLQKNSYEGGTDDADKVILSNFLSMNIQIY